MASSSALLRVSAAARSARPLRAGSSGANSSRPLGRPPRRRGCLPGTRASWSLRDLRFHDLRIPTTRSWPPPAHRCARSRAGWGTATTRRPRSTPTSRRRKVPSGRALMSCDEAYEQHLVGGDAQTEREHVSAREPGSLPLRQTADVVGVVELPAAVERHVAHS